ncbi:hypothetical protein PRK78_002401 [Emydomyces testavorans]|uniref:Uncharacterized protein n=1 Tax=Emydomyces testavorans TaxID=2070801 RepID=A0AAF0DE88_9EURO|nr:hypothetical protein PRK78_002401 [Emydomyces testavorans]
MSYSGYNFSSYQYQSGRGQPSNPSHSASGSSALASGWQNTNRDYSQQDYAWQGQNPANMQGSNPSQTGNAYWSSNNDTYGHAQDHSQQGRTASPNVTPSYQPSGHSLDPTDRPNSAQRSRNAAVTALTALSASVPNRRFSQSASTSSSVYSSQNMTYIPTVNNTGPTNDLSQPEYSSNLGLSTRQSTGGQSSNTLQPPAVHMGQGRDTWSSMSTSAMSYSNSPTTQSGSKAPGSYAPQNRTSLSIPTSSASRYGSVSTGPTATIPSPSYTARTTVSETSTSRMNSNPPQYPTSEIRNQDSPLSNISHRESVHREGRNTRPPQSPSQTSLPTFVDPSKIYDPYHDYERAKAAYNLHNTQNPQDAQPTPAESDQNTAVEQALVAALTGNTAQQQPPLQNEESEKAEDMQHPPEAAALQQPESAKQVKNPRKPSAKRKSAVSTAPTSTQQTGKTESAQDSSKNAPKKRKSRMPKAPINKIVTAEEQSNPPPASEPTPPATNAEASGEGSIEEKMASEMRLMIERMRELRSKDPSLFAKLWDGVKKGPSSSQTSPAVQTSTIPTVSKPTETAAVSYTSATQTPTKSQDAGTTAEKLPDLGKFPAARRKRRSKPRITDGDTVAAQENVSIKDGTPSGCPEVTPKAKKSRARVSRGKTDVAADENRSSALMQDGTPELQCAETANQSKVKAAQTPIAPNGASKEVTKTSADDNQPVSTPQLKKASNTWPLERRQALADAACKYIKELPQNEGKECPASLILGLIDQDPSYPQLCEMVEAKGLFVNRVHFAKHLLKAVPSLASSQPGNPPQTDPSPIPASQPSQSSASTGNAAQQAQPPGLSPATHSSHTQTQMGHPPMYPMHPPQLAALPATNLGPAQSTSITQQATTQSTKALQTPSPMNPPTQAVPTLPRPSPIGGPTHAGPFQYQPTATSSFLSRSLVDQKSGGRPPSHFSRLLPAPNHTSTPAREQRNGPHSVPPAPAISQVSMGQANRSVDKDRRFRQFNPASLYANGKSSPKSSVLEPAVREPPPGSKAAQAKKRNFSDIVDLTQSLDDDEDMEDIEPVGKKSRLDELRPSDSVAASTESPSGLLNGADLSRFQLVETTDAAKRDALRRRNDIIMPFNKAAALRRSYYNPKTIARDILIAAGRHPTEKPLNYHLLKLREIFQAVDYNSDLRSFRWDLVDPGSPPPEVPLAPLPSRPPIPSRFPQSDLLSDASRPSSAGLHNQGPRDLEDLEAPKDDQNLIVQHSSPTNLQQSRFSQHILPSPSNLLHSMSNSTHTPRRGRGRPPGAKNKPKDPKGVEVVVRPSPLPPIDLAACFKDKNGRSWTPKISEQGPHPALIFPAASSSIRSFNKIHGNKTERSKAMEVLRALEIKKARVGIGVSKGGCTLFNYKRLPAVAAFENVRRIIPADSK